MCLFYNHNPFYILPSVFLCILLPVILSVFPSIFFVYSRLSVFLFRLYFIYPLSIIILLHSSLALRFFLFFHSCCLKCFQLFLLIICYNLNHQVGAVTFHLPPNKCETNLHNVCACFCSQLVYCCDSISFFTRITRCFALVFKINKN